MNLPPPPGTPPPPPPGTPPPGSPAPEYPASSSPGSYPPGSPYPSSYPPGSPPPGGFVAHQDGAPPGTTLADFGSRLGAFLLDGLLYGLVGIPFAIAGVISIATAFRDCESIGDEIVCPAGSPEAGPIVLGVFIFVIGALLALFLFVRALARTGQPWGSRIVGVKVVRAESGALLGTGRALGRTLFAYFLSGSICYLGYLWMLWDPRKQTWHDKVTDSVVIRL